MNNEYSSDTKKVAAKLAGMTDACANVHDDERLTELFALAPDWAVGIVTEENGRRFWSTEIAEIGESDESAIKRMQYIDQKGNKDHQGELWQEIPPRERDLNQLAQDMGSWYEVQDYAELSEFRTVKVNGEWFRFQEWKERRDKRIAAGLIDVNDINVVDKQDSRQEWVNGLPPVGSTVKFLGFKEDGYPHEACAANQKVDIIAHFNTGNCDVAAFVFKDERHEGTVAQAVGHMFEPLQLEQKPDERDKARDEIRGMLSYPTSDDEKVVDLILEWHMSRLTQRGRQ